MGFRQILAFPIIYLVFRDDVKFPTLLLGIALPTLLFAVLTESLCFVVLHHHGKRMVPVGQTREFPPASINRQSYGLLILCASVICDIIATLTALMNYSPSFSLAAYTAWRCNTWIRIGLCAKTEHFSECVPEISIEGDKLAARHPDSCQTEHANIL